MKQLLVKIWRKLRLPTGIQLRIMRLFQDEFLIGVTGIVFNDRDEVLLVKHTYRGTGWSLIGGYIKGREHPMEGLEREIKEETNFIVSMDQQMKLRTDRNTARLDISYIGTFIGGEFSPSTEVSEADFFSFEQLPIISRNQLLLIDEAIKLRKAANTRLETDKRHSFADYFRFRK